MTDPITALAIDTSSERHIQHELKTLHLIRQGLGPRVLLPCCKGYKGPRLSLSLLLVLGQDSQELQQ